MYVRIQVPVTLYCDVEIPSTIILSGKSLNNTEEDADLTAIDDINDKIIAYLSREEGIEISDSISYPAICNIRIFPADDNIPAGEWEEVDRQENVRTTGER